MNNKFDELAKGLAQSVTRRQALKRFGVGLAGMALACFGLADKARATTYTGNCGVLPRDLNKVWRLSGLCFTPDNGCVGAESADCTVFERTSVKRSQCGYVAQSKRCSFTV